jgi:hypothetical protein
MAVLLKPLMATTWIIMPTAALTTHLDLREAIHVGHSTGGGEVAC